MSAGLSGTGLAIAGSEARMSSASNTTGNRNHFPNARPRDVILPGPFLTEEGLTRALASLQAKAELAERNGLPRTARSWRDAIKNLIVAEEMRTKSVAVDREEN